MARTTPRRLSGEFIGTIIVVGIGCLMAFSSGTSNIANAIAPLVGSGDLEMNTGIILGSIAVAISSFTLGRRTLDTLGNDLTTLPLTASIAVASVSATIVTILSAIGIPASFVIIATMSIIGLGWGPATRTTTVKGIAEEDEEGDAANVEPVDQRRIVPRVDQADRGVQRPRDIAEHRFHALTDATAVRVEFDEGDVSGGDEGIEVGLVVQRRRSIPSTGASAGRSFGV